MVRTSQAQLHLSPVSSGQKLKPKAVGLRQASVHPGQASPGTAARGRRRAAAAWSRLVHIRQIWVILQSDWREPVPLGQHGIARPPLVEANSRKRSTNWRSRSFSRSSWCAFLLPQCVQASNFGLSVEKQGCSSGRPTDT